VTWEEPIPLTNENGSAQPFSLVTFGAEGTVVGFSQLDDEQIARAYLRRSPDRVTSTMIPLFGTGGAHTHSVSLGSHGQHIDVVWIRHGGSGPEVKYRRSDDAGITWSDPQSLAGPRQGISLPRVARNADGTVAVVWHSPSRDARIRVSTDGGTTFGGPIALENRTYPPSVGMTRQAIIVAYRSESFVTGSPIVTAAGWPIVYRRSTDDGKTWQPAHLFVRDAVGDPQVHGSGRTFVIAVPRYVNGNVWIAGGRSLDHGASWSRTQISRRGSPTSYDPVLSARGGIWRVAYQQCVSPCTHTVVRFRRSTDLGLTWSASTTAAESPTVDLVPRGVGATSSGPVVSWSALDVGETVFMRYGQ
jgi:hypothetical protein